MAPNSSESVQKSLSDTGSQVTADCTRGDAEVTSKYRKTQTSLKGVSSLWRDSNNLSATQTSSGSPVRPQWTTLALSSMSGKRGPSLATLLSPNDLSWSSSTARTFNRPSPGSSVDLWDLPETPPRLSDTPSPAQTWTPLTPPTPPSPSLGRRNVSKTKFKELPDSYFHDTVGSNDANNAWQEKDEFRPKKLFRNYTQELERISKANAAAAQIKYSMEPSLVFSPDEPQPISSRTRSKTKEAAQIPASENIIQNVDASSDVAVPLVSGSGLPSFLELILPLDLYKRLGAASSGCIGSVQSKLYVQCGNRPKGSLGNALAITRKFARYRAVKDYKTMILEIEELVCEAMCGTHKNVVLKEVQGEARIETLKKHLCGSETTPEIDQQALDQWLDAISSPKTSTDHIPWVRRAFTPTALVDPHPLPCKSLRPTSQPLKPSPNAAKPNGQISSFANFTPFQLNRTKGLSVSDALLMEIQRPISANEINSGFIYMFWDKRYFGKLKIGRTDNIKRRLKEWNRQCGKTHSYLSQDNRSCVEIPHVGRVERLIHTELKECREKRKCEGCGVAHQEWFGEDEVHAIKVVRKWQEWMMHRPYVRNSLGQWELRSEILESLGQVCEPLARDKVVVKQVRKSEGSKRTSRKRGGRKTI